MLVTNIVPQLLHLNKYYDFDLNQQTPGPKSNALTTAPLRLVAEKKYKIKQPVSK
jgi:hypothetical protein